MQIPAVSDQVPVDYGVRVAKKSLDVAKDQGEAAVKLIEQSVPPVGQQGQGSRINTYG